MLMKIQPLISCRILDRYILHGITPILPIVRCVYVAVYGVVYHIPLVYPWYTHEPEGEDLGVFYDIQRERVAILVFLFVAA